MKGRGTFGRYCWMLPILLLAFLLRVAYLDGQSMWWDEAFSVTISNMDLQSLLAEVLADRVHPPLYYLVLRVWLTLGQGEFVVRALSAFLGVLGVASLFPMATLVDDRRLGAVSAFALAISPMHIWYSQEARMYSLVVFLTVLANYFFARLLRSQGRATWFGYGITTLLAVHTHYLALFVILAQMTFLTITRGRHRALLRNWLLCMLIVGLLSSPWFGAIFLTGGFYRASISWIRPAIPQDLFWTIYDFGLGSSSDPGNLLNILAAVLLTAVLVYVSLRLFLSRIPPRQRSVLWLVWLWLFLPLILVFLISLDWPLPQKRSIYMDRFLIPSLPAFLILISHGITQLFERKKVLGVVVAAAMLVPTAASVYAQFSAQTYRRDDWRQAIADIRAGAQGGDLLLVRTHDYVPLHYYDLYETPWFTVPYLDSADEYEAYLDAHLAESMSADGRLWTMVVYETADPHRFSQARQQRLLRKVEEDEVRIWLLQNFRLLEDRLYSGVCLSLYEPL